MKPAGFLLAALGVHVAAKAVTVHFTLRWLLLYTFVEALLLVLMFWAVTAVAGGRRAVLVVVLLLWVQSLPVLAWSPPLDHKNSFNAQPFGWGSGVDIVRQEGWTQYVDGLGLEPGTSGVLVLKVRNPRFRALYLEVHFYRRWGPHEFENRLEISSDGMTFRPLRVNAQLVGDVLRLNRPLELGRVFLRFSARNPSPDQVLVVDDVRIYTAGLQEIVLGALALMGLALAWPSPRLPVLARVAAAADRLAGRASGPETGPLR